MTFATHANYATDGIMTMDTQAQLDFLARALYQLCSHVMRQTPSVYGVQLDPAVFLNAYSFRLPDDEVICPSAWVHAPSGDIHGREEDEARTARDEILEYFTLKYFPKMVDANPYILSRKYQDKASCIGRPCE